jgi:hypothetical protein
LCLPLVTRYAVQDENVVPGKARPVKEQGYDFYGKREVFILEQESLFKDAVDKVELGR